MLKNLSVGVDDWQRKEMLTDYYPEGLPEDWRADFYLNDFATVLIAQAEWTNSNQIWLEELLEAFRAETALYLRLDDVSALDQAHLEDVLSQLGDWVAGFVVFDQNFAELELLGLPVTLVRNSEEQANQLKTQHNQTWLYQMEELYLLGNPLGYLPELPADKKQQAKILQDFAASLPGKNSAVPFFVGGQSIKMGALAELKTLAELLGY